MSEKISEKPIKKIEAAANQAARAESEPRPVRRYRTILFQVGLIIIVGAFAVLTFLVKVTPSFAIDLKITRAVQLISSSAFAWSMRLISWPGFAPQSIVIAVLVALFIYVVGLHWESVMVLIATTFSTMINVLVKDLVQRPRPTSSVVNVFAPLNSYSFPSGHVMFYISLFGFLWFLTFTLLKPSIKRTFLLVFFGGMVALIGLSRVYLGQHWASDTLGSYLLGTLTLAAIIQFYLWGKKRFFVRQPVAAAPPTALAATDKK